MGGKRSEGVCAVLCGRVSVSGKHTAKNTIQGASFSGSVACCEFLFLHLKILRAHQHLQEAECKKFDEGHN